ncbi:MAG: hypothetical protein AB1815_06605 [Bacillota bacterium]|jgi:hypothetical protein
MVTKIIIQERFRLVQAISEMENPDVIIKPEQPENEEPPLDAGAEIK